jgi:hypothetical protein
MSRNLPPRPNLEHLKKQAKDLLHDLKQQHPASKLADAQYALAREYGFASWPKLKVHVESLPRVISSDEDTEAPVDFQSGMASERANPFVGKWIANVAKSRQFPGNEFQSATMEFGVDGDRVTIIDVVVDDSGREHSGKNMILVDGNEHLSENSNGYILVARWRGPQVIETIAKKDGQIAGWGTYEVSEDGKTMTISGNEQMIVLDRD